MKYYVSPDNLVYAFEADGSQDHLIWKNFVAITEEEAKELNRVRLEKEFENIPKPSKEVLQAQLLAIQAQIDALKD